jgi:hypothetical protein
MVVLMELSREDLLVAKKKLFNFGPSPEAAKDITDKKKNPKPLKKK